MVDIVIPFYNTPIAFMCGALDSVLRQTYRDWRAIIVNDASGHRATAELESLIGEIGDPRIIYRRQTVNRGVSAARNTAIEASDSPYVALLDSDDLWYPHKLESQVAVLEGNPRVAVVHGRCDLLKPDGSLIHDHQSRSSLNDLDQESLFLRTLRRNTVGVLTAMIRRSALEAIGKFDDNFACIEDKELWLRLLLAGEQFHCMEESLGVYRLHRQNMSKDIEKMKAGRLRLIETVERQLQAKRTPFQIDWPTLKREMLDHVYEELAEGYIEVGDYLRAVRYSLPPYRMPCGGGAKLCVRAIGKLALALPRMAFRPSAHATERS